MYPASTLSAPQRAARWAPTGPCPIVPRIAKGEFCKGNGSFVETRDDVPRRPWFMWEYKLANALGEPAFYYVAIQLAMAVLCCIWVLYKSMLSRAKNKNANLKSLGTPLLDNTERSQRGKSDIKMVGYRKHALGTATFYGILLWSTLLLTGYVVTLFGTYYDCQFVWPDALCSFGDFRIMGTYVLTVETHFYNCHFLMILFGILIWMKTKGSNWFLQECPLCVAEVVFVEKSTKLVVSKSTTTSEEPVSFLKPFIRMYNMIFLKKEQKFTSYFENCKVRHPLGNGEKFILFQCQRYIWDGSHYALGQCNVSSTDIENFRRHGSCLSSSDVATCESLVGKNVIDYNVESYFEALVDEVMAFRYLYQLYIYMNWIFTHYWHVGGILSSVVGVSALVRVYVKHKAKQKIFNMTRFWSMICCSYYR